jgi:hypothetical protein
MLLITVGPVASAQDGSDRYFEEFLSLLVAASTTLAL